MLARWQAPNVQNGPRNIHEINLMNMFAQEFTVECRSTLEFRSANPTRASPHKTHPLNQSQAPRFDFNTAEGFLPVQTCRAHLLRRASPSSSLFPIRPIVS